jgi:hypothetical protein
MGKKFVQAENPPSPCHFSNGLPLTKNMAKVNSNSTSWHYHESKLNHAVMVTSGHITYFDLGEEKI